MGTADTDVEAAVGNVQARNVDLKLEVVVIPVSNVDRARDFYVNLGWRVDADVDKDNVRLVQLTPQGSACSVQFGTDITPAPPGSAQWLYLVVSDVKAARDALTALGVEVSEVFHEATLGDRFHQSAQIAGPCVITPATGRSPPSAIPTATRGCSKRSLSAFPAASTAPQHPSRRQRTWRMRCGELRRPTATTRNGWASQIRTGRNGMRTTWWRNRQVKNSPPDASGNHLARRRHPPHQLDPFDNPANRKELSCKPSPFETAMPASVDCP